MGYSFKNLFTHTPVQIAGAIQVILNVLVMVNVLHWSAVAIAGVNSALVVLLGLFVANTTVNTAKLQQLQDELPAAVIPSTISVTGPMIRMKDDPVDDINIPVVEAPEPPPNPS